MKNLKDYRNKELKYYVLANFFLIFLYTGMYVYCLDSIVNTPLLAELDTDSLMGQLLLNLVSIGILSSVGYVYVFILDSFIPSNWKYKICYLYFGKKPGYTIFSDMRKKVVDDRITEADVLTKYRNIYERIDKIDSKEEKMNFENKSWYSIYSTYKDNDMVFSANRDYLLCRDLCVVTILIVSVYIIMLVFTGVSFDWNVLLFLIIEFLAVDLAFWAKGKRLAYNVITLDIHKKESQNPE